MNELTCYRCSAWPCECKDGQAIVLGDAREILPLLPAESIGVVATDPPYGMDLQPQRGATKAIAGDVRRDAKALWWSVAPSLHRVLACDTASVAFGRWSEEWAKAVLEEWFTVKGCVVWIKNNFGIGYYLRPQWELAWYFHKGTPPVPETAPSDVWDFRKVQEQVHSCEKPVALIVKAIEHCGPGDVLDPFLGSGTALLACKRLGRRGIGIEIDERYCEIAANRLRQGVLVFEEAST